MLITSNFPIDETFLSLVTYEGILYYLKSGNIREAIKSQRERLNKLKNNLKNFEKTISIRLTGNDLTDIDKFQVNVPSKLKNILTRLGLKEFADIKWISKYIKQSYKIEAESEKDAIKMFILQNISRADLESVEEFYGIIVENYISSNNWFINDSKVLEKYLNLDLGTKIVCLGKIKKEFELFINKKNEFDKFRQNLIKKLNNILSKSDLNIRFENIIPCIFPVYMRLGFPEQLLEKILPNHYTKERIFRMILEKKEKGSGESTYNDIIALFMRISDFEDINVEIGGNISIEIDDKKKNVYIYILSENSNDLITAPQILKCDRYTGFSTFEEGNFTDQFTLYISPEMALLYIIGLTNSLVSRVYDSSKRQDYYYFLFFSPEEISKLYFDYLEGRNGENIRKFFIIKDEAIKILREIYQRVSTNEIALTELALNLKFQELLNKYNLNKVSFTLFKVALEGNTYKIYEQIPITIYRKIVFAEIVERYFKNPDGFIKSLAEIFENKGSRLWRAVASLNSKNKLDEADNVLKAMQSLYRFVVLGDLQGYYQFTREIFNCYRICASSRDEKNRNSAKEYKQILEKLRWF